jgi:hypothetical protein
MAVEADRQSKTPRFWVEVPKPPSGSDEVMLFRVHNVGSVDLDSVTMYRPRLEDQVIYPIAVTGQSWAKDEIEIAPLAVGDYFRVTFNLGSHEEPIRWRFKVVSRLGEYEWPTFVEVDTPGKGINVW